LILDETPIYEMLSGEEIEINRKHANEYYQKGVEYYYKGDLDLSIIECEKACELDMANDASFNMLGIALGDLAKSKEGKESEELYRQAFEKYKKAIEIKPDKHEAFYNWGNDLGNLAKSKEGKESEELYRQAFEKYKKAIEIKPDKHEAYNNWGNYLGNLAKSKEGKESEELYRQAFEKFKNGIGFGGKSYNLACLYSLQGDKNKALYYLNLSLKKKEISVSFVRNDEDWKGYLLERDFIDILNKYT